MIKEIALRINGMEVQAPGGVPTGGTNTGSKIISVGVTVLFIVAILLALLFLLWGGIDWIMSEGDKNKVHAAREKIVYSIVGIVVVLLSFFIVSLVSGILGVKPF
jgi:NADH:ubiquinone oxidoreductase subunit 5 (subunit L)/multisubunit Na+/H+ antiporter MnhA subunit